MANALNKVNSGGIEDGSIVNADVKSDAAIAGTKLADNAVGLDQMAGGTDGQIITYDASGDPVAVGPGTDGQVLTSTGAGSPPAFETLPTSGAALTGSTNNTICTVTGADAIAGEANLTWDGDYLVLHKASSAQTYIRFTNDTTGTGTSNGSYVGLDGDENLRIWNIEDKHIRMCTNNVERIRIENDGDVYIGNSDVTGGHLFIYGKDGNDEPAVIELHGKNSSGGDNPKAQVKGVNNTYAWASDLRFFTQDHNINLTEHFRIDFQGNLTATDTTIGSISDSRLKTNIANYTYDLAKFKQFQPKTFDWKNPVQHGDKSGVRGFLAQDLEAVDSSYVSRYLLEETVTKGNEDGTTTTSTNPDLQYLDSDGIAKSSKFGPKDAMYVSVINQLITKIETLETKVAALEAK